MPCEREWKRGTDTDTTGSGPAARWDPSKTSNSKAEKTWKILEKDSAGLSLRSADFEVQGTQLDGRRSTELEETELETGRGFRSGTVLLRDGHAGEIVDVGLE